MTKNKIIHYISATTLAIISLGLISCSSEKKREHSEQNSNIRSTSKAMGLFCADSAYQHIQNQLAFGPRVPNTQAHTQCADWIKGKLHSMGYTVDREHFLGLDYFGQRVKGENIIAKLNPQINKRILLMAHWDTRPVADEDIDSIKQKNPHPRSRRWS